MHSMIAVLTQASVMGINVNATDIGSAAGM